MLKAAKNLYIAGIIITSLSVIGLLVGSILVLIFTDDSEFIKNYASEHNVNEAAVISLYITYGVSMAILSAVGVIEIVIASKALYNIKKDTKKKSIHVLSIIFSLICTRLTPLIAAILAIIGIEKQKRLERRQQKNSA